MLRLSVWSCAVVVVGFTSLSGCAWLHAPATPTKVEQTARAVAPADRWDLSHLYASDAAFDADMAQLNTGMQELVACEGQLGKGLKTFKRCMSLYADNWKRLSRLGTYASTLKDEDTRIAQNLERLQSVQLAQTRLNEATSFLNPELLALGQKNWTPISTPMPRCKDIATPLITSCVWRHTLWIAKARRCWQHSV